MGSFEQHELNGLRNYIEKELSQHNQLIPGAFPISERVVKKGDQICGIFFCLHGPRSVRLTAVFDANKDEIHFYDSNGRRVQTESWTSEAALAG